MIQKLVVGLLTLVVSFVTPMAVMDHIRFTEQITALGHWSHRLEVKTAKLDFKAIRLATQMLYVEGLGNGSGVRIASTRMLTAAHVASIDSDSSPLLLNGKRVKVLKVDEELDLALLEVEPGPYVELGVVPAIDSVGYIVGYPMSQRGVPQFLTEGRVMGHSPDLKRTFTAIPAAPGNSGGGLFAYQDGKWKLTGILVSVSAMGGMFQPMPVFHMSHSVDIESIKKFLA